MIHGGWCMVRACAACWLLSKVSYVVYLYIYTNYHHHHHHLLLFTFQKSYTYNARSLAIKHSKPTTHLLCPTATTTTLRNQFLQRQHRNLQDLLTPTHLQTLLQGLDAPGLSHLPHAPLADLGRRRHDVQDAHDAAMAQLLRVLAAEREQDGHAAVALQHGVHGRVPLGEGGQGAAGRAPRREVLGVRQRQEDVQTVAGRLAAVGELGHAFGREHEVAEELDRGARDELVAGEEQLLELREGEPDDGVAGAVRRGREVGEGEEGFEDREEVALLDCGVVAEEEEERADGRGEGERRGAAEDVRGVRADQDAGEGVSGGALSSGVGGGEGGEGM